MAADPVGRNVVEPRRWTLHGLNNGAMFYAIRASVSLVPRVVSYALSDAGTWVAHRLMSATRAAVAHNLEPIFPDLTPREREQVVRRTMRDYARDTIDFLLAQTAGSDAAAKLFQMPPEYAQRFAEVLALGRGAILVTGHHGNWEIGSLIMTRLIQQKLVVVSMAEANEDVNALRREIRSSLGVDTIEVRQSLDTALQIRRRLSENCVVAMLMDRHLGRDRVRVTFLGRSAWFLRTPALMGYMTGAPLMPCFIERTNGTPAFSTYLGAPIFVSRTLPRDEAIQQTVQQFADQLGTQVRRHPEHWYQFYRYWDSQHDSYEGLV